MLRIDTNIDRIVFIFIQVFIQVFIQNILPNHLQLSQDIVCSETEQSIIYVLILYIV